MEFKHLHDVDSRGNLLPVIFPNLKKDDQAPDATIPLSDQTILMKEVDPKLIFGPKLKANLNVSKSGPLDKTLDMCGKLPTIVEDEALDEVEDETDQTNVPDCTILAFFAKMDKGAKVFEHDFSDVSARQEQTIRNASLTCVNMSNSENKNHFGTPIRHLSSEDPKFAPLDVAKGNEMVYVVSQITNTVGIFQDGMFKDVLRFPNTKYFNQPRNVIYTPTERNVFVLDNNGIHVFNDSGEFARTLLKDQGYKYRGLANYQCLSQKDSQTHLVSLDVSTSRKQGTFLCVFVQIIDGLKEVSRIPIHCISNPVKSQCRFVSVHSLCTNEHGCLHHKANVTDSGNAAVYQIDIKLKTSKTFSMERVCSNPDTTFNDEKGSLELLKPTGICVDLSGNVYVADKDGSKIEIFSSTGLHMRTIRLLCHPLGINFFLEANNVLLVADLEGKKTHLIQLK